MSSPLFLFAPGAGAPSSHPWMQYWVKQLQQLGEVRTLDYPYMLQRSRRPDPLPRLIAAHRSALEEARGSHKGAIILAGKSMGGRIGCHVSLATKVAGLICFGYPLCGGGDPNKLRDKVLCELTTPILFLQGTRDKLCPLDLLESVRQEMKAPNDLFVVESADHSLGITKSHTVATGETQADVDARILDAIRVFISRHVKLG